MRAQALIECNYQELHNKNSVRGEASLINAALNLVSLSIGISFQVMLCLMIMCSKDQVDDH